jgi:hypothetical protein
MKKLYAYIVAAIIIILVLALATELSTKNHTETSIDVFVGVDAAYTGEDNSINLIDQVKS